MLAVFMPVQYWEIFGKGLVGVSVRNLGELSGMEGWPGDWVHVTVVASGSNTFLPLLAAKLKLHQGALVYSTDMIFAGIRHRDLVRQYIKWAEGRYCNYGLTSCQLAHHSFGGATSTCHLVSHRGLPPGVVLHPTGVLHRVVSHCINPTTSAYAVEVEEPPHLALETPVDAPIYENGVLRGEGLYDLGRPSVEVFCQSVFKRSGWVRRRLSAVEYLRALDVPLHLDRVLLPNKHLQSVLAHGLSPSVVSLIIRTLWEVNGGLRWKNPGGP